MTVKEKTTRVLLIEDNVDDEGLTIRALRQMEPAPRVDIVRDGDQAVKWLYDHALEGKVDLILLDLKLPRYSGLDVLAELRAEGASRNIRVVVFSSSDEKEDVQTAMNLGANGFVKKPLDYEEFRKAVQSIVNGWDGEVPLAS